MNGKWILVADKLPAKDATVLGYDSFYGGLRLVAYDGHSKTDDGRPWLQDIHGGDDYYITHWMALPDIPNVEISRLEAAPDARP